MHHNLTGDCLTELRRIRENSFALIMTSPPYADARKKTYGGVHPDKYAAWFMRRAEQFERVLKPDGTLIVNIKERVVSGQRHTYVIDIIKAMQEAGWLWTEQWIWHKKNVSPGKWPNRFRDAWDHMLQFNLQRRFAMHQDEVRVPIGDWAKSRLSRLSTKDKMRVASSTGSGFAKNVSNWQGRDTVYPTNVLHMATECATKKHSAVFPSALPEFFIKLFSKEGDWILDPFAGSGTTGVAAVGLGRDYVGIDAVEEYAKLAEERIRNEAAG